MGKFTEDIATAVREFMLDPVFIARVKFTTTGRIFWVMETGAADQPQFVINHPAYQDAKAAVYTTVELAMDSVVAKRGDVILVDQEYTQTIAAAAGIDLDKQGVKVVGLGRGTLKPTLTLDDVASDVLISAADCQFENFRFVGDVNDLVNFVDVNEGGFTLKDCDFVTSSAKEALGFINLATTKDDFKILGCTFIQPTDPAGSDGAVDTGAIFLIDSENILVEDCSFVGFFETAIFHNRTTKCINLVVKNCELSNEIVVPFILVAAATGVVEGCYGETKAAADATEATVYGTIGVRFWISQSTSLGNDSATGGQGSISGTVAT